ncbi:MAG: hypothetical protein ACI4MI_02650 [Christensenellales bacterium]
MKKISVLTIILIVCLAFSMIFSGCSKQLDIQEGIEYFEASIQTIKTTDTYYIRTVVVENASNSKEYQLNVKGDNIHYTIVSNQASNTSYLHTYYSDNNKYVMNKVDGKDVWSTIAMTKESFLLEPTVAPYSRETLVAKIDAINEAMKTGTIVPTTITQGDYVTTYTFDDIGAEMSELLGGTAQVGGKFPLTIETIADRINKIVDSETSPKIKYYIVYEGPKITIPKVG